MLMWHVYTKWIRSTTLLGSPSASARCGKTEKPIGMNKNGGLELSVCQDAVRVHNQGTPNAELEKWTVEGAGFQRKDDGTNHPELRGPTQAAEIGHVLSSNHILYLCQENRKEQIYYTSHQCFSLCSDAKEQSQEHQRLLEGIWDKIFEILRWFSPWEREWQLMNKLSSLKRNRNFCVINLM